MCGRYAFVPQKNFFERFEIVNDDFELAANYNVSPGQEMPIILRNSPKRAALMRWGLIPFWAKSPDVAYKTINARSEGIENKPAFRGPIKNKRCLIPATGFYEWDRKGTTKVPYLFLMKDRATFAFAGLWDEWTDEKGEKRRTYTILTTGANALVGRIHDRMPVILRREDEEIWTDNTGYGPEKLKKLMVPFPHEMMDTYRVSQAINSSKNNNPELMEKLSEK